MSRENVLQPLNNLLTKAQGLLMLAHTENWDDLPIPFAEYQQQMSLLTDVNYLQALKEEHLVEEAKILILKIQDCNQKLDSMTAQAHADIASELRQLIQADKALDAYRR